MNGQDLTTRLMSAFEKWPCSGGRTSVEAERERYSPETKIPLEEATWQNIVGDPLV
jgi:hypothetical protein